MTRMRILAHPSMKYFKRQVYFELTDSNDYRQGYVRNTDIKNCHLHCVDHDKSYNSYHHVTGFSFFDINNDGLTLRPAIRTLSKPKYVKPELVKRSGKLKVIGVDLID